MVKRINIIRRVNLFELGSLLSPLCLSGMKSMCHSTYGLTVIVGAALFGGEWHFPWCNYTHRNTRHVNMSCVTRSGLLHCHCGGTLVLLSKTHPHLYVIDLNTLVIHFFSHNPEKKNILPSDLLPIYFCSYPLSTGRTRASPLVWLVVIKARCLYIWKIKQNLDKTNRSGESENSLPMDSAAQP